MKNLSIALALGVALFLSACWSNETANSDTVKQSEIHQNYWITYNAGDKELSANASFRFGGSTGTTLALVSPSTVEFDGTAMSQDNNFIIGTYYNINRQEDYKKSYSFKFTDGDSKTYSNSISCNTIAIKTYPNEADKGSILTVSWDLPIVDGEKVTLYLEDSKNKSTWVTTDAVGATSLDIVPESMKDLFPGDAKVYLTREVSNSLAESSHIGGNITLTYSTSKVSVKLTGSEPAPAQK